MKTFLILFALLELVALIYAVWYHLKGKDSPTSGMTQCQSCGMPLQSKHQGDTRGTEANGSLSSKWCKLCYANGQFLGPDCTLQEMIEIVDKALKEQRAWFGLRWMARKGIPRLERWQ